MPLENQQANNQHTATVDNAVGLVAAPAVMALTALHEVAAHGYSDARWVQEIPGIDHASSVAGSWAVAAGITLGIEKLAARLDQRGHQPAAERMRRAGNIIAWSGAVACQAAIESTRWGGVSDFRDVIAGSLATIPGIIHGHALNRRLTPKTNRR